MRIGPPRSSAWWGAASAHDPIRTAVDGLREFAADEIVFAVKEGTRGPQAEQSLLARAEEHFAVPVSSLRL